MIFKRGDTFTYSGVLDLKDYAGGTVDPTGWTVKSSIFFPDVKRTENLTASLSGTVVGLELADTTNWPLGPADIDVSLTTPTGTILSTGTFRFEVVKGVSNDA